jgi:hypothetical protein
MQLKFSAPKFFTPEGVKPKGSHPLRKHFGGVLPQRRIEFGIGTRFLPER